MAIVHEGGHSAECAQCKKRYRVPAANKTYRCKGCGGELRVEIAATVESRIAHEHRTSAEMRACGGCEALQPAEAAFCGECGQALHARGPANDERETREGRLEVSREVKRARETIATARIFFAIFAVVYAGLLALSGFALWRTWKGESVLAADDPGLGGLVVACGVLLAMEVVAACGFFFVRRHPFPWVLLMASLQTIEVVSNLVVGGGVSLLSVGLAVAWWVALVPILNVARLVRAHPELSQSKDFLRESRGEKRAATAPPRSLRTAREDPGRRTLVFASIGVVVALAAIVGGVLWYQRPPALDGVAERFRSAYKQRGHAAMLDFLPASERATAEERLGRLRADPEWSEAPELDAAPPSIGHESEPERATIRFASAEGEIATLWHLRDGEWALTELRPPVGRRAELFRDAWNRSDIGAVAANFSQPDKVGGSLRKSVERRGWSSGLPQAESPRLTERDPHLVEARYETPVGTLTTWWRFEDQRWSVSNLELPSVR